MTITIQKTPTFILICITILLIIIIQNELVDETHETFVYEDKSNCLEKERNQSFLFIGGFPRSGTNLMSIFMESHPNIFCGPTTRVIPNILLSLNTYSARDEQRLREAGMFGRVFDCAVAAFIIQILKNKPILGNKKSSTTLICSRDSFQLADIDYLSQTFPNAKYILVLRDGRAVVNSILTQHIEIVGLDINNPQSILQGWEKITVHMLIGCLQLNKSCIVVKYEHLILNFKENLKDIFEFLNMPWHEDFLKNVHFEDDDLLNNENNEMNIDLLIKQKLMSTLSGWTKNEFLTEFNKHAHEISPLIGILGYDVENVILPTYKVDNEWNREKLLEELIQYSKTMK